MASINTWQLVNESIEGLLEDIRFDNRFDEEARGDKAEALGWGAMDEADGYDMTEEERAKYNTLCDIRERVLKFHQEIQREINKLHLEG